MGRVFIIAATTYREAGRQPILYILTGFFAVLVYLSRWFTLFSFKEAEEMNMIREMGVASLTICGVFASVVLASLSITSEVEKLTTLTILSKPVHRSEFLLGKYFGLLWVVFLSCCFLTLTLIYTLWEKEGSRKLEPATDLYDLIQPSPTADAAVAAVWPPENARTEPFPKLRARLPFLFVTLPEVEGPRAKLPASELEEETNRRLYQFRLPGLGPCPMTHAVWETLSEFLGSRMLDLLGGVVLAFVQIAVVAAFAVGVAPHLPLVVNGAICLLVFVLGHLITYAHDLAQNSHLAYRTLIGAFYILVPNLSLFNASGLLSVGSEVSARYVAAATLYGLCYLSAVLVVSMALFSHKEVG